MGQDELKTLKDLEFETMRLEDEEHVWGKIVTSSDLRQEAIKRIKELEPKRQLAFERGYFGGEAYIRGKIDFIQEFFNITEEDLK